MESYLLPDGPQTPSERRPANTITQNRITEHLLVPSITLGSGNVMGGGWYESGLSTSIPISSQHGRKLERLHRRGWRGENSHFIDSLAAGTQTPIMIQKFHVRVSQRKEEVSGGHCWFCFLASPIVRPGVETWIFRGEAVAVFLASWGAVFFKRVVPVTVSNSSFVSL